MAEPMETSAPETENSRKRSLPDDDNASVAKSDLPTPPLTASPAANQEANRQASPAPSTSTLSSAPSGTNDRPADPSAPPRKRRKFTPAEKEEQRLAKEQKDRERAEARQKRDEEKRKKNEEKEAKQREKDLKKAQEDEEKQKKARAQPKIASFFKTPAPKQPSTPAKPQPSPSAVRHEDRKPSLSQEAADMSTPTKLEESPQKSDYSRMFLPFQLKSHTTCAPCAPPRSEQEARSSQRQMDQLLERIARSQPSDSPVAPLSAFFAEEKTRSRGLWQPTAREVIEALHGTSQTPIDLTDDSGEHYHPTDLLNSLTVRHIHFGEDVRPPYFGTYSRKVSARNAAKMRTNPFNKLREDTNYDYDSEAEWEEPEEGEDIMSDGEDDEESVGSPEEMDGFVDDDASDQKRHIITGDLKPVSTGLCWEDVKGHLNSPLSESSIDLNSMKIGFFIPVQTPSINPFSTAYWETGSANVSDPSTAKPGASQPQLDGKMKPPRNPLQPRSIINDAMTIVGAASGMKGPIMAVASGKATKPAAKPLQGQDLAEFKDAVEGSNLTKNDLQKALKKRFPKHTNDVIKATLSSCFARIGQHEVDKVWKAIGA